jgi:hypothetical protein
MNGPQMETAHEPIKLTCGNGPSRTLTLALGNEGFTRDVEECLTTHTYDEYLPDDIKHT